MNTTPTKLILIAIAAATLSACGPSRAEQDRVLIDALEEELDRRDAAAAEDANKNMEDAPTASPAESVNGGGETTGGG